jgi:NAD(P)-dependent dehydrogenase (short-subunit alcohol dehydrogenase family)
MINSSPVWLVTGCSSGFGRSIAEAALAAGHRVVATARDERRISDLESAGRCLTVSLDVTDSASIQRAVDAAIHEWGRIDVLVNNAGYGLIGAVEECSLSQARKSIETLFIGPLALIQAVLPTMRSQGSGHILQMGAAAAITNYPGFGIYGGAKAALECLSESLRAELSPFGIRVSVVIPGPFRTDFINRGMDKGETSIPGYERTSGKFAALIASMDGKQPGDVEKAAQAILQLVAQDHPPFRLMLGRYANQKAKKRSTDLEAERQAWEHLGLPTDR